MLGVVATVPTKRAARSELIGDKGEALGPKPNSYRGHGKVYLDRCCFEESA